MFFIDEVKIISEKEVDENLNRLIRIDIDPLLSPENMMLPKKFWEQFSDDQKNLIMAGVTISFEDGEASQKFIEDTSKTIFNFFQVEKNWFEEEKRIRQEWFGTENIILRK